MRILLLPLLLVALCNQVVAQAPPTEPFNPNYLPSLEVHRTPAPIHIDGDLNDTGWEGAARATNFAEFTPGDRTLPPVRTEVLVAYDDTHLYLGFYCYDNPEEIRASLHDRDQMWNEDMVGIILDTYGDAARSYEIFTNAKGIQGDLLWTADNEDTGFDLIFESQGKITADGYQVEMAIPFSSLRFPDRAVQTWRATFWRIHPRASRQEYSWAAINHDDPCQFCQYGTLTGIENIKPGGSLELLPSLIGFQSGALKDDSDPSVGFENGGIDGDASLGVRYAITPSIGAEATINPDFSQVESDAAKIDVNSTFALSYPERRPFFQEGGELFRTWINGVYTRSINEPLVAGKLIGKAGNTSIGYIGAYDENTPILLPFEEFSAFAGGGRAHPAIRSVSNILRLRHAYGDNSFVGALATDRRFLDGGSGSTLGVDGLVRFLGNFQIEGQLLASHTHEPLDTGLTSGLTGLTFDNDRHTASFDGERFWGHALYASLERGGRNWNLDIDYTETSPAFRAADGFVNRNSRRELSGWSGYSFYPENSFVTKVTPSVAIGRIWNFDWLRKDEWVKPTVNVNLIGQTSVMLAYLFSRELFRGVEFDGIRIFEAEVNSNFSDPVSLGLWFSQGRFIARGLDVPVLGRGVEFNAWGTLKPIDRFNLQPGLRYSSLDHPDGGGKIFSEWVGRLVVNYQFTRELSLRFVAQYVTEENSLSIEPLLTYKLNPFSIFYIGSTHAYRDYPEAGGFNQRERQFFAKIQYLIGVS